MNGMEQYLRRYGGQDFAKLLLNDIDLLVFAQLSYCDFLAVPVGSTLCEAAQVILHTPRSQDDTEQRFSFQREDDEKLMLWVAACPRYRYVTVRAFERKYDEENLQFAALCLHAAGKDIVVYRGTDNTLAGWKEDLDLCFRLPVAAQSCALDFFQRMAEGSERPFILCGHSKGGGLSLYAALFAGEELRSRIAQVVSFDGVGLPEKVLSHFENNPAYAKILDRIRVILPEGSIVGVIFPQPGHIRTVDSRYASVLQHYPYNWVIDEVDFVDSERTLFSRAAAIAFDEFLDQLTLAEREKVITLLYEIIRTTKAQTIEDVLHGWLKNTVPVAKAVLEKLDTENAKLYLKVVTSFYRALGRTAGVLLGGDNNDTDAKGTEHNE